MKKIDQYSLLSLAFLTGAGIKNSDAQIITYQNINPDIILEPDPSFGWEHYLDVSMDGEHDFRFMIQYSQTFSGSGAGSYSTRHYNATVIPYNNGGLVVENDVVGSTDFPLVFNYGNVINSGLLHWFDNTDGVGECCLGFVRLKKEFNYDEILLDTEIDGYWLDQDGKFIGMRIKIEDDFHYGWIRVSVNEEVTKLTIHDFAYNSIPNAPITAGETGMACNVPFPLAPVPVSPTITTLKWQQVIGADIYKIKYRISGPGAWTTISVDAPKKNKKLTGLICDTEYQWKIAASCDGGATFSDFSDVKKFNTGECRLDNDMEIDPQISVYPNPSSEMVFIDLDGITENTTIEIYDLNGKLVQILPATSNEFIKLDVSSFISGLYLLNIKGASVTVKSNFLKQ